MCGLATTVSAYTPNLNDGYDVTNNWHGIDAPVGATVVATALTTDASVYQVTFIWKNPGGNPVWTEVVPVCSNGTTYTDNQGNTYTIYYAEASPQKPGIIGDWGVEAVFQGPDATTKQDVEYVVAIRATSFNVIPEIPLIGTAGAATAMFAGLAYKLKKKPQKL